MGTSFPVLLIYWWINYKRTITLQNVKILSQQFQDRNKSDQDKKGDYQAIFTHDVMTENLIKQ